MIKLIYKNQENTKVIHTFEDDDIHQTLAQIVLFLRSCTFSNRTILMGLEETVDGVKEQMEIDNPAKE